MREGEVGEPSESVTHGRSDDRFGTLVHVCIEGCHNHVSGGLVSGLSDSVSKCRCICPCSSLDPWSGRTGETEGRPLGLGGSSTQCLLQSPTGGGQWVEVYAATTVTRPQVDLSPLPSSGGTTASTEGPCPDRVGP